MKVIVASFQCESNSLTSIHPQKYDFEYFTGWDIFKKLTIRDKFTSHGIEIVPSIYANALPSGTVERDIYEYYKNQILDTVRSNTDADGIYIYVHGSMEVEGIGSGELQLLKEIRQIIGRDCLIALTMDLHANITQELNQYADIICGYKTAPHVDQPETESRAVDALIYCLEKGIRPHSYTVKIPMLIKGDLMLTAREPLKSLIAETREFEKKDSILSVNLFFGHCWIDAINTSASVVVTALDEAEGERTAKYFAEKFWSSRFDYRFSIEAGSTAECVNLALAGKENRIFLSDSGDNTTAGADGTSLDILKLFLEAETDKRVCVSGITDPQTVEAYWDRCDGDAVFLPNIGQEAILLSHGEILGWAKEIIGRSLTFRIGTIDCIFTEKRSAFIEKKNFDKANVDLLSYQIVVVKLGYLFTELKPYADRELFALSDGTSCVEVERLGLKNIMRPMYPLDPEMEWSCS